MATQPRQRTAEERQPTFVVRAPDPQRRGRWLTLGAAWARPDGNGYNVKLNTLPVGTGRDGALVLLPPFVGDEMPEQPQEDRNFRG